MAAPSRRSAKEDGSARAARRRVIAHTAIALIALIGLADATYLTVLHLTGDDAACGASAGCSVVLGSAYAAFRGIPTAAFGAVGYFLVFGASVLAAYGYARARAVLAVVVTAMFGATLWLLYLQAFVLHAFCPYCLLSAALTFLLAGIVLATPGRP